MNSFSLANGAVSGRSASHLERQMGLGGDKGRVGVGDVSNMVRAFYFAYTN